MSASADTPADSFLLAIGYHGEPFKGSQSQPDEVTVQGELNSAIKELGWQEHCTSRISSRTDSGVSSRMNLVDISCDASLMDSLNEEMITRAIGDRISSGMCIWGAIRRQSHIPVRMARSRTYLYRLDMVKGWNPDYDAEALNQATQVFLGHHNFSAFSRPDPERSPFRTIDDCRLWRRDDGSVIGLIIEAESFLWNQVRRIASAIVKISNNETTIEQLASALEEPSGSPDFGRAPADALILWNIHHEDAPKKWYSNLPKTHLPPPPPPSKPRLVERWRNSALAEIRMMLETDWTHRLIE